MADLQQILGAVLRDITKSRFSSDIYSRSIARYYENDYLLRKFPVPRTEIEQVEVALKFVIAGMPDSSVNGETREANVAFLFERTGERLVATFIDTLRRISADGDGQVLFEDVEARLRKSAIGIAARIAMRQNCLRYFVESYTDLIDDIGQFDSGEALGSLQRPFRWAIEAQLRADLTDGEVTEAKALIEKLVAQAFAARSAGAASSDEVSMAAVVKSLIEPVKAIWTQNHDARLEVLVDGDRLAHIPAEAISTVQVTATVRNHVWTEVKTADGETKRQLTSE